MIREFRADLHIHTVLSACASLEMSPEMIIRKAVEQKLDMIAITDHNSTLQCRLTKKLGKQAGIFVLGGVEVTTREDVHVLAYFGTNRQLEEFGNYIDKHLPRYYMPESMGFQTVLKANEKIGYLVGHILNTGIRQSIEEVCDKVHELGGVFIPAHVERQMYGLYRQLGILPAGLKADAMGITRHSREEIRTQYDIPAHLPLIQASDAHEPDSIGKGYTLLGMKRLSFSEFKKALMGTGNRYTRLDK